MDSLQEPLITYAFSIRHDAIVDAIYIPVKVSMALEPLPDDDLMASTLALWDTGATHSCISDRLARQLGLEAADYAHVATASGIEHVPTYFTHLFLPNGLQFLNWELMQFRYTGDESDLIIGMDIITKGDFSITNLGGRTLCSFRIPSQHLVDYETLV
jgi:gag-polyprotein putative aspartyl protease